MGRRISYFKIPKHTQVKDLIFDNFGAFRQWFLDEDKASMDEFNEPFGNVNLTSYLSQNTDFKADFDNLEKSLIDELTAEFIGGYCDARGELLERFGHSMSQWRYEQSTQMVIATKDEIFIRLWDYLVKGRSLKDGATFDSYTNECKVGFLAFGEHRLLNEKIIQYFGKVEDVKMDSWFIFKDDPKTAGFEYVLRALDAMGDYKNELIILID